MMTVVWIIVALIAGMIALPYFIAALVFVGMLLATIYVGVKEMWRK